MAVLILLALTIVGFLILLDRRDTRVHDELKAHREEITNLVRRIQAPQVMVASDAAEVLEEPELDEPETEYPGSA